MTVSESDASLKAIEAVERRVLPAVLIKGSRETGTLEEALAQHNVPAVSVAVISGGRLQWARAYGAAHAGGEPVNPETLFQSCSISKTIAAMTALRLVAGGLLDLDQDVSEVLKSWQIPDNPFTGSHPVTLRLLLSHRAGINVGGFPGYEPDGPIPTLAQVLRGEPPCNTDALRVETGPGAEFRYSGGGMQIVQQLLEDVSGAAYGDLARREVFEPAGMEMSTFASSPLGASSGHDASGQVMRKSFGVQPELAAAGLWSTPSDLAMFAISVQQSYEDGGLIPRALAVEALTRVAGGPTGLGFFLDGDGDQVRFSHSGGNTGFRCHLVAYASLGLGAVVMTNGDNGNTLLSEVLNTIADAYEWPGFLIEREAITFPHEILERYTGVYLVRPDASSDGFRIEVRTADNALSVNSPLGPGELLPESETHFFGAVMPLDVEFHLQDGRAVGFTLSLSGVAIEGVRVEDEATA